MLNLIIYHKNMSEALLLLQVKDEALCCPLLCVRVYYKNSRGGLGLIL